MSNYAALVAATEAVAALFPDAHVDDDYIPFIIPRGAIIGTGTGSALAQRRSSGRSWMLFLTDTDVPDLRWHVQTEDGRHCVTSSTLGIEADPVDVAAWFTTATTTAP